MIHLPASLRALEQAVARVHPEHHSTTDQSAAARSGAANDVATGLDDLHCDEGDASADCEPAAGTSGT
jgi:hypothetical protein